MSAPRPPTRAMGTARALPICSRPHIHYILDRFKVKIYFINIDMLVRPLYRLDEFEKLRTEVQEIIQTVTFEKNQIICQNLSGHDDWHIGIGSIEELEEKEEKKYCYLNSKLKNTELEKLIQKHNAYRTRIMLMPPRQCYSVHSDPTPRLHIPLITNRHCWMIWPTHNSCYHLKDNIVYWTDTTKNHTFINGGLEDRIHIVMCISS
jgi:hypothetical protein